MTKKKLLIILSSVALLSTVAIGTGTYLYLNNKYSNHNNNNNDKNILDMGVLFSIPSDEEIKKQILNKFNSKYQLKLENIEIDEKNNNGATAVAINFNTDKIVSFKITWTIRTMVPTKYVDGIGREFEIYEKDLGDFNIKKITQIGYYENEEGEIQIVRMPAVIEELPSELPKEITSLKRIFGQRYRATLEDEFKPGIINKEVRGIENWDTSNITNMSYAFESAYNFDQDISNWNVSNVTNMFSIFESATNFNQNLSSWNVSEVTQKGRWDFNSKIEKDRSKWPKLWQ